MTHKQFSYNAKAAATHLATQKGFIARGDNTREPFLRNLTKLSLATGLRPSECLSLTWNCINWRTRTARVNGRVVMLNPVAVRVLRGRPSATNQPPTSTESVFHNPRTGRPWSKSAFYREWKRTLKTAGIAYQPPCRYLRDTFVKLSLDAGESAYWIASQLGYKHFSSFERRYGRQRPTERPQEKRSRPRLYERQPQSLYDGHRLSMWLGEVFMGRTPCITVRYVGVIVDEAPPPTWWPSFWQTPGAWL